jgi:hypothetical protein
MSYWLNLFVIPIFCSRFAEVFTTLVHFMVLAPTAVNWLPDLRQGEIFAQLFCMIQLKVAR